MAVDEAPVIACAPVCGSCEACAPLAWALRYAQQPYHYYWRKMVGRVELQKRPRQARDATRYDAVAALLDPVQRAELFARALRGRGAEPFCQDASHGSAAPCIEPSHWADTRPAAILALARLLAVPLDGGAEAAFKAIGVER
ncbi:hypothetical protein [Polyangium jinanense]|uniref:Uncharacterized protein n=1 Tax=Polyangium jinanense TaxID=2829994 RepID=A0A9X3XFZ6_9BACT|nr:hypothetical protein [Polyangium jinanense]MDC3988710.1 hypothetical protein [Polyangium jinanense]